MSAANYASIKLSAAFVDEARREADVLSRSIGAQVEYWAKLGRAVENTPGFDVRHVREMLGGRPYGDDTAATFGVREGPAEPRTDTVRRRRVMESARWLAGMGGSQPDFEVPPRRRPDE